MSGKILFQKWEKNKQFKQRMLGIGCMVAAVGLIVMSYGMSSRAQAIDTGMTGDSVIEIITEGENSYYQINSWNDMEWLRKAGSEDTKGKTFKLVKDLPAVTIDHTAKGTFAGTFAGQGYKITIAKLSIDEDKDSSQTAASRVTEGLLFGKIAAGATVSNIFVVNSDSTTTNNYKYEEKHKVEAATIKNAYMGKINGTDFQYQVASTGTVGTGGYKETISNLKNMIPDNAISNHESESALQGAIKTYFGINEIATRYKAETAVGQTDANTEMSELKTERSDLSEVKDSQIVTYYQVKIPVTVTQTRTYQASANKSIYFGVIAGEVNGTVKQVKISGNQVNVELASNSPYSLAKKGTKTEYVTVYLRQETDNSGKYSCKLSASPELNDGTLTTESFDSDDPSTYSTYTTSIQFFMGGVTGVVSGEGTISEVYQGVPLKINTNDAAAYTKAAAGGIAGSSGDGADANVNRISDCQVVGNMEVSGGSSDRYCGGMIGKLEKEKANLTHNIFLGTLTGATTHPAAGGYDNSKCTIENCFTTATLAKTEMLSITDLTQFTADHLGTNWKYTTDYNIAGTTEPLYSLKWLCKILSSDTQSEEYYKFTADNTAETLTTSIENESGFIPADNLILVYQKGKANELTKITCGKTTGYNDGLGLAKTDHSFTIKKAYTEIGDYKYFFEPEDDGITKYIYTTNGAKPDFQTKTTFNTEEENNKNIEIVTKISNIEYAADETNRFVYITEGNRATGAVTDGSTAIAESEKNGDGIKLTIKIPVGSRDSFLVRGYWVINGVTYDVENISATSVSGVPFTVIDQDNEDGAYIIDSWADLQWIGNQPEEASNPTKGKTYKLTKDLTIETPVSGNPNRGVFQGTFDGNGHTITFKNTIAFTHSDSSVSAAADIDIYSGVLFGTIADGAIVKNLFLDFEQESKYAYADMAASVSGKEKNIHFGLVAGKLEGAIERLFITGKSGFQASAAGNKKSEINTIAEGAYTSANFYFGGVAGSMDGGNASIKEVQQDIMTLINNRAAADHTNTHATGGIVGKLVQSAEDGLTACYTNGGTYHTNTLSGDSNVASDKKRYAGGFIGVLQNTSNVNIQYSIANAGCEAHSESPRGNIWGYSLGGTKISLTAVYTKDSTQPSQDPKLIKDMIENNEGIFSFADEKMKTYWSVMKTGTDSYEYFQKWREIPYTTQKWIFEEVTDGPGVQISISGGADASTVQPTKMYLTYNYLNSLDNKEKNTTVEINPDGISGTYVLPLPLGENVSEELLTSYVDITEGVAKDLKYYYVLTKNMITEGAETKKLLYDKEAPQNSKANYTKSENLEDDDTIAVTATLLSRSNWKVTGASFYYRLSSDEGEYTKCDAVLPENNNGNKSNTNQITVNIPFPVTVEEISYLEGYWAIAYDYDLMETDKVLYEKQTIKIPNDKIRHNDEQVKKPTLTTSLYMEEDAEHNMKVNAQELTETEANVCMNGQTIIIQDVTMNTAGDTTIAADGYQYQYAWENTSDAAPAAWTSYTNDGIKVNIDPDKDPDSQYLFIRKTKPAKNSGEKSYVYRDTKYQIKVISNMTYKVTYEAGTDLDTENEEHSGNIVMNGEKIHVQMNADVSELTGLRTYITNTPLTNTTLVALDRYKENSTNGDVYQEYTQAQLGTDKKITITLNGKSDNGVRYLYLQMYGSVTEGDTAKTICTVPIRYILKDQEQCVVPNFNTNTYRLENGNPSGTVATVTNGFNDKFIIPSILKPSEDEGGTPEIIESDIEIFYTIASGTNALNDCIITMEPLTTEENADQTLTAALAAAAEMYYIGNDKTVYIKSGYEWKRLDSEKEVLRYDRASGITLRNTTEAALTVCVGAIAVEKDKEPSVCTRFRFSVTSRRKLDPPTATKETLDHWESALMNTGVAKGEYLSFQSEVDSDIYYTIAYGQEAAAPSTETADEQTTFRYDRTKGIHISTNMAVNYVSIKAVAVRKDVDTTTDLLLPSETAAFVYALEEAERVLQPTSTPVTTIEAPAVLNPGQKILLSSRTNGATIFYTTNGTDPQVQESSVSDNSTKLYIPGNEDTAEYNPTEGITMPLDGTGFFTIKAVAVKQNLTESNIAELVFLYPSAVQPPYASPSSGTVELNTKVTLGCATTDALIYYEIAYGDDSPKEPTVSSAIFDSSQSFTITRKTTIKAMAVKDSVKSEVATYVFTTSQQLGAPTASIASGSVVARGTTVTFYAGDGAAVYYTTDGSDPTLITNTAVISGTSYMLNGEPGALVTIKLCAKKNGSSVSEVVTYTYQISKYQGGITSDTPSGSTISRNATVNLMTDMQGASIYYTLDGSQPGASSTSGTSISMSSTTGTTIVVKAVAIVKGGESSAISTFIYTIKAPVGVPNILPAGGVLSVATKVAITAAADGSIYYTLDGTEPTAESGTVYAEPITVNKAGTLKAIVVSAEGESSAVAEAVFTLAEKAKAPEASPVSATVEPGTTVRFTTTTPEAKIYYSTDGTIPNAGNYTTLTEYTGPVVINRTVTIQAVAYKEGLQLSKVSSYTYTVDTVMGWEEKQQAEALLAAEQLQESDTSKLEGKYEAAEEREETEETFSITDILKTSRVSARVGVLPADTTLSAKYAQCDYTAIENLHALMGSQYSILETYDLTLFSGGSRIQPDGSVRIELGIPKGYENATLSIIRIEEDNTLKVLETYRGNDTIYAYTDHFSTYAVVGMQAEEEAKKEINLLYLLVGATCLVALAGGSFAVSQIVKRKKEGKNYPKE